MDRHSVVITAPILTTQLRAPMQKVTDRIMKACRTRETRGKVIKLRG